MSAQRGLWAAGIGLAAAIATCSAWAQTPKRGGTLTYVIPADEERAIAEETARYLETNR